MEIQSKDKLGIELGSTRIKAVLIDENHRPVASGSYDWENKLENGIWTYKLDDVWSGFQSSFRDLADSYGKPLTNIGAIGISAMMHGYMAFDKNEKLLVPFRTWRNTVTGSAADRLTDEFGFNIPQRWSIAHFYQAILNNEEHIKRVDFLTTLAGYVHQKLTGEKVIGIGDASGMFPIDGNTYNQKMIEKFNALSGTQVEKLLPKVLIAGEAAGRLTEDGAKLIDPSGQLASGIPLCPPEGDAGTGMVATNSIAARTGNVSAGTSIFAMTVLEKDLSKVYPEVDVVTTPAGKPVAMVHCNNCTTDIDAWVKLLGEAAEAFGVNIEKSSLYDSLYNKALSGEKDGGGLLSYNYYSGEHITGLTEGRPLLVRTPDSRFTLPNLMRTLLYSSIATLKIGMDILAKNENVRLDELLGHGGLFKTPDVGQRLMASALNVPVSVMETAGEGGAWGIALLAAYMLRNDNESLEDYLAKKVFGSSVKTRVEPAADDVRGFEVFMERYKRGIDIEQMAVGCL